MQVSKPDGESLLGKAFTHSALPLPSYVTSFPPFDVFCHSASDRHEISLGDFSLH
jgi:hypothetical protein